MTDIPFVMTGGVNYIFSGTWHAGDTLTLGWSSVTVNVPCGAPLFSLNLNTVAEHIGTPGFTVSTAGSYTFTLTADATQILVAPFTDGYCSAGTVFGATLSGGVFGYCQYGVEANPDASIITVVTSAVVDVAIAVLGGGPLMILAFDTLIGAPLLLGDLCSQAPPPVPTWTADDFIPGTQIWSPGSFPKRMQALRAAVWGFYCRCVAAPPGSPTPVVYPPPPVLTDPVATGGTNPPVVCDTGDLCTSINAIMRQLAAMNAQLTYMRSDVQLIQRQKVPFAYVPGTVHSGLTGAGEFAVSGILGLSVTATTVPLRFVPSPGDPTTYYRLGWVNTGTVDGWQVARELRHNPELIFDLDGSVTRIGYDLADDVVATIAELVREP